jgi:hypothetical protein
MTTPKNTQARNHSSFKKIRKQLLEDDPTCTICGKEADTIDHIKPVDTFTNPIEANTMDNCRVLCRSCNSRLGARYVNAKTAGKLDGTEIGSTRRYDHRTETTTQSDDSKPLPAQEFFFATNTFLPPKGSHSVSAPYGVRVSEEEGKRTGHYPRLRTTTEGGDFQYLELLEELALRVLGVTLMPWQRTVLGDQLALDAKGNPFFKQSVVSVARQNGKSVALKCLLLFWMIEMPRIRGQQQTILSTAHRLDLASELFQSLAPIMEEQFGAKVIYSYGRQQVEMPAVGDYPGSRWLVRAATPSAGHGLSIDLLLIDELYGCSAEAIEDGMIPTQRARKNSFLSAWSTAGTEESTVFKRWRERGIAEIDTGKRSRLYYAEFSPPSQLDPMKPEAWPWANPALGFTLDMETIEEESKSPNKGAFMRSAVNCWITGHRSWLDQGWFATLGSAGELPAEGGWLAIEASQDDNRFVAVRAVQDGKYVKATVEFIVDNLHDLWEEVEKSRKAHKGMQVACGATLDVHLSDSLRNASILVGQRELQRWTTVVRSMTMQGVVLHTGEELLIQQVDRAVLVKHQGHMSLSSARSPGPIELCRAYVWAVAKAAAPKDTRKVSMGSSIQ